MSKKAEKQAGMEEGRQDKDNKIKTLTHKELDKNSPKYRNRNRARSRARADKTRSKTD